MHCSTFYTLAATALLALTVHAAPYPTATLAVRDYAPTGTIARRAAASTGFFERRDAEPTAVANIRRNLAPSGVFGPSPSGSFPQKRAADSPSSSDPPFPIRDTTTHKREMAASCSCSGGKAPIYTLTIPAEITSMQSFGPICPAQGFIDTMKRRGVPLFGFGCMTSGDDGVTLTFSSSGRIGADIDAALDGVLGGERSWNDQCQRAQCT